MKLSHVTRDDVLEAAELYDELGGRAFLARFGYADSIRYRVRVGCRSYPSKPVLGVVAELAILFAKGFGA